MAVLTPTRYDVLSLGNLIGVNAVFSSVANNDTWAPGLMTIQNVEITNGASGVTNGATISGSTITFLGSGAQSNVRVLATGT